MDLKEIGIDTRNWVDLAQNRDYWTYVCGTSPPVSINHGVGWLEIVKSIGRIDGKAMLNISEKRFNGEFWRSYIQERWESGVKKVSQLVSLWFGDAARMEIRNAFKIIAGDSTGTGPLGRPRYR